MNTDTSTLASFEKLGAEFNHLLAQELGDKKFKRVVRLNACEGNPNICHSHDFCDANMVMAAAFEKMIGHEIDLQSDEDTALWNAAWDHAKKLMLELA